MIFRPRFPLACALPGLLLTFAGGCASSKSHAFVASFLPPEPVHVAVPSLGEPPSISASLYANSVPNLLNPAVNPGTLGGESDERIAKAEERYQAGKSLYRFGDVAAARREFDTAIDVLLATPVDAADRPKIERKIEELADGIHRIDIEGLGAGDTREEVVYQTSPLEHILETTMTFPTDPRLAPKVKEELQATVSQLPLEQNDAVLTFIRYFSSDRGHRTVVAGLRRAGRYRPMIQRILDEEGVPRELIYLAQIESGFYPHAISNKAATGMWQFLKWRGNEYGLEQTRYTDDRLDPEKATRAAAHHLRDLYNLLGDWYLAMAAYNCGPYCVDHAVQHTGYADFWELRSHNALPVATMNYVPAILALTIMAKNPKDYGLDGIEVDRPLEYDTVDLEAATSVALLGDMTDRPVTELRDLNPALLGGIAPAGTQFKVPKGMAGTVASALHMVPAESRAAWRMHRVERGETLPAIAKRFRSSTGLIASANKIGGVPQPGDLLMVPVAYRAEAPRPAHRKATAAVAKSAHKRRQSSASVKHRGHATAYAR